MAREAVQPVKARLAARLTQARTRQVGGLQNAECIMRALAGPYIHGACPIVGPVTHVGVQMHACVAGEWGYRPYHRP